MIRIGADLFNGDHTRLGEEVARTEAAGIDFFHLDVFDGYFVPEQAFAARSIKALRRLTSLPFEIHLAVREPMPFLEPLKDARAGLVFLPAESTRLLYETIYAVRERGMKAGLCLALGTPLSLLRAVLPMLDSVLLLRRITGDGDRGRDFNQLVVARVEETRRMIEEAEVKVDLQAAGGLETDSCIQVCRAGATSLPLGKALYRETDMAAYILHLRSEVNAVTVEKISVSPNLNLEPNGPAGGTRKRRPKFKVLIASRSFGENCPEILEKMTSEGCQFLPRFDRTPKEEELMERMAEADALISGTEPVTARVLAAAPRLKVISKHGVGTDNIDLEAARAGSIVVTVAGGAVVDSVADLTLALLLSMARQIPQAHASVRSGQWDRFVGSELRGKILGIVGLGRIGKAVGCRARSFGMRLMAFDAHPDLNYGASWGVQFVSLEEIFSNSDFITLHAPLKASTKHLVKAKLLSSMRPTAYLINTSRGELVDETALYEALKGGKIAGAATDVFAQEPPPANHPLLTLDNFIATPHCGSQTNEALRRMGEVTAENTLRVLRGEKALFQI